MKRPFLIGERLYLRPLEESDLNEEYLTWLNDYRVSRFLEAGRFPVTLARTKEYLQRFDNSSTDLILALVDKQSDLHVGNVTLNRIDWINRTADTGLIIGRTEFRGKGYAFEAWALLLDYAFRRLGLHKVTAGSIADNVASVEVLKRLGFELEGTFRSEILVDGAYRDVVRFGLLQEEFEGRASRERVQAQQGA